MIFLKQLICVKTREFIVSTTLVGYILIHTFIIMCITWGKSMKLKLNKKICPVVTDPGTIVLPAAVLLAADAAFLFHLISTYTGCGTWHPLFLGNHR